MAGDEYIDAMAMAYEKIPFEPGQSFRLLKWTDNVREVEVCKPDGQSVRLDGAGERWHFHPELELTLVTHGQGRRFVGDHLASFEGPDLVLIGSNLPHYWSGLRGSSGYALQFVLDADHPLWQLAETSRLRSLNELAAHGAQLRGPIVKRAEELMRSIAASSAVQGLIGMLELLSEIASVELGDMTRLSNTRFALADRDPHLATISNAVKYILENIQNEIRLEDLLRVTHMSKPTFCRQFKRHTGRTLVTFVNEVRVDHARRLLVETTKPITEVAYESGFANLSHFNRQFRRVCDCSPRDLRRDGA